MVSEVHSTLEWAMCHICEVLGKADHLGTFIGALFNQTRTSFKVLLSALVCAELDYTDDALKSILLGRQGMLVVCDTI